MPVPTSTTPPLIRSTARRRPRRPVPAPPLVVALLAVLLVAVVADGCARATRTATVEPLAPPHRADRTAGRDPRPVPPPTTVPAMPDAPSTSSPPRDPVAPSVTRDVVDAVGRYDRALTAVAASPDAPLDPDHPLRSALAATVEPGAALADDVVAGLALRRRGGSVVRPGPGGSSWVHHVGAVVPAAGDAASFTWCGWSPGVAVDLASGTVTDDTVAVSSGTGTARKLGGTWVVSSLDQLQVDVLPAGTPDPCPSTTGNRP